MTKKRVNRFPVFPHVLRMRSAYDSTPAEEEQRSMSWTEYSEKTPRNTRVRSPRGRPSTWGGRGGEEGW